MRYYFILSAILIIAVFMISGCGGGGGGSNDSNVAISISPVTTSLSGGGSVTITATVTGDLNTAVTWSIVEGSGGGTLSSITATTVKYTAPNVDSGVYHVKAVSKADPTKSATATINVQNTGITVTLSAVPTGKIFPGDSTTVTATVNGAINKAVTWSLVEGQPGTLSNITDTTVTFTAPNVDYLKTIIKAVSKADPTKSAQIELITDTMPPPPPPSD